MTVSARTVVLYGDYSARQAGRLEGLLGSAYTIKPVPYSLPAAEIAATLAQAQVMVANAFGKADPAVPRLTLLQSPSAGMEGIDASVLPKDCQVRTVGGHEIPMAEYAICTMLDWQIGYRTQTALVKDGRWSQKHWIKGAVHREVFGATLGIAGFGRIGREIAKRALALGMRVRALSRWSRPEETGPVARFTLDRTKEFLADCDFVAITLPLDDMTQGSVNADWFAAMKPDAVLINLGRGKVVDEAALYNALRDQRIRGATIDVWYNYPEGVEIEVPMASFPFHKLPNIVVTPHCSGRTDEMFQRRWREIADNVATYFDSV
jgi:phosphoglycerate dehydrogenase-like enzyme